MRVDVGKFLLEKLHEFLLLLGSCWSFLVEKLAEVFSPVEKIQHVGKFLLEKLHEFVHLFENFWSFLVKKLDEVFPPETRAEKIKHWLEIGLPVALPAALLLLCICCCGTCWLRRSIKMMKAPGRGYMMPRHVFESDPRSYFINLRSTN
ncbi:hypothetical protein MRB53_025154 [Persea americana]|uniref:Uncharacterized protein n=1 Tax=Persea americana TaxID=3435 RepID=A0ACC2LEH9_PERAE|nr:hypothetical protein MRB53_025154 [Persea americana]